MLTQISNVHFYKLQRVVLRIPFGKFSYALNMAIVYVTGRV